MRQEWDGQLLLGELEPVERLEPPVVLDVVRSILEAAITLRDIGYEQMLDDTLGIPIISQYRSKLSGLSRFWRQTLSCDIIIFVVLNRCLLIKITREFNLAFQDLLVDCHGIIIVEGIDAGVHLVGENSKSPPVDWLAVALVEKHLRSQVFRSSTESICARLAILCETKICQFQISLFIDQNVFGLQIPVDDVERVEVFEHETDLGGV